MSLFKANKWWSNAKSCSAEPEEVEEQSISCMKVDKFGSHDDSDCILLGESKSLKLYKPSLNKDSSLLEIDLDDFVLQIETGKFVGTTGDREIIILHPQSYVIYELHKITGLTDAGDQNNLVSVTRHSFKRRAYSLIIGPFGSSKARDLICIQSLDGTLSFFDQETFLFMCIFNDILIPGPISYVASSDLFIISKSTWILEIYSYQQLRELSELSLRQNQNNLPQWTYNAGEEISAVQVIRTSSNFSSIIALGERHLYCFQDNGLMKDLIRFDYTPICFHSYLIGWYYEPGARLLVMVASDDSKLYVYEGITLLWMCDLMTKAVSLSRCFLNSLPGGIVTLSTNGVITVNYLGTEPDLNPSVNHINDVVDPAKVQNELESVEAELKSIIAEEKGAVADHILEKTISIKAEVGTLEENLFDETFLDRDGPMCPLIITLTCEKPELIQSIQITFLCNSPFTSSEPNICLEDINNINVVETRIYLSESYISSYTRVRILFTIVENTGKVMILHRIVMLPLRLYCSVTNTVQDNEFKLCIQVSELCTEFKNLFSDFTEEELVKIENISSAVSFVYRYSNNTVTVRASDQEYYIESNDFPEITSILDFFLEKLNEHYNTTNVGICITIKPSKEFIAQLIHRFLKSIEIHSKERIKLKILEDELIILHKQFTVIQKKLLVQYGSLPPGDCDPLEFLMKDTHERLIKNVEEIIQSKDMVCRAGNTLSSIGRLFLCILKNSSADTLKTILIEDMLSFDFIHDDSQEWEEAVTQVLSFVSNKLFKNSEKDKEKLAPVTEQEILSHINIKRFLKHLRIILERTIEDVFGYDSGGRGTSIVRTEELVEVI